VPEYTSEGEYLGTAENTTVARVRYGYICKHNDIRSCPVILTDAYPSTRSKRRVHHVCIKSD
jgi:hypothetical protein